MTLLLLILFMFCAIHIYGNTLDLVITAGIAVDILDILSKVLWFY